MEDNKVIETVNEYIEKKDYVNLKKYIQEFDEIELADIINSLEGINIIILFRMLSKTSAAIVFTELESDVRQIIIEKSTDEEVSRILNDMFIDDMVDFIEEMPANAVTKILRNASKKDREVINQILKYPSKSAGSIMTTEYMVIKSYQNVEEALEYINQNGKDKVTIYTCYVTNQEKKLLGFVSLRMLLTADVNTKVSDIMEEDVISVRTLDDQEEVTEVFKKYDYHAIPVVDEEDRLVGIITVDDIIDVMEEEDTEDFQKMAAMAPSEEKYLKTSFYDHVKHRIGWLLILMVSSTFSGQIIDKFTEILAACVVLTRFIPMLMGTGGNSGNQSSTLIIRGLATGELELSDWRKVLEKEFKVSIITGFILAGVNFIRLLFVDRVDPMVGLVVSSTMIFTVMIAMIIGGLLPLLAQKMKMDPALMAAPLITTIVDVVCLVIYFSVSGALLGL